MALLISADDSIRKLSPQDLDGSGYIQAVRLNPVIVHEDTRYTWLIINEEGKLLSLPINNNATLMAVTAIRHDDYIVGDALMLEEHEFQ